MDREFSHGERCDVMQKNKGVKTFGYKILK